MPVQRCRCCFELLASCPGLSVLAADRAVRSAVFARVGLFVGASLVRASAAASENYGRRHQLEAMPTFVRDGDTVVVHCEGAAKG